MIPRDRVPQSCTVLALFLMAASAFAQAPPRRPKVNLPPPNYPDVKYGPYERNLVDFWQAKSSQPTPVLVSIHGGGFVKGEKSVSPQLLQECLHSGISVAAINYRYSTQAIAPACFHDCARAVQFIRSKAKEWNIDPTRVAATGGSAAPVSHCGWAFMTTWPIPTTRTLC